MDEVFIKKESLSKWIAKYFPLDDLITFDDMIGVIEDLDSDNEELRSENEELKNDLWEVREELKKYENN